MKKVWSSSTIRASGKGLGRTSIVMSIMPPSGGRDVTFWPRRLTSSTTSLIPTAPIPLASRSSALISFCRPSVALAGMMVRDNISWAINKSSRMDNVKERF